MIAPALEALKAHRQFILYRLSPSQTRPGKTDKFPCDASGRVVSAHDSAYWLSYDSAASLVQQFGNGWGIGFVLTPDARRFCLDIDNCLQPDGQWSLLALQLCAMFPGAAIEVSQSNCGLHIWGSYTGDMPLHGCKNEALGIELYTDKRFIALGRPDGTTGNVATDCTMAVHSAIALYFPPDAAQALAQEWTTAPCAEWRGPSDDDALIQRAMRAQSTASAFGGKATFADLWSANAEALGRSYPDPVRPYDASQADAALAQRLAWWTGRDCERIERLMRQSALARDKWDSHSSYLSRTILKAVGRQFEVFVDEAARRREQIEEAVRIGEGSDDIRLAGTITLEEMLPRFVFIQDGQQVVDLERPQHVALLQDWKSTLKASMTTLEVKGQYNMDGTPKTKTRETSALWEMSPSRQIAQAVTFLAGGKRTVLDPNGRESINTWKAPERSTAPGDPSIFLEHVGYLFGAEAGRFIDWLAHIEQQPGELPQFGWLHVSDKQGTGRNWIASVIARLWTGYAAVNFDLAHMFKSGFNDRLSRKLIAVVDEIDQGASTSKHDDAQKLKSLVNEGQRTINPKFGRIREEFNACRWLVFSNHRSALALHDDDRRFNVSHFDGLPRDATYYKRLYAAMRDPAFIAGVAHMLKTRDLTDFNPGAHAVMNAAKQAVIAANRSETDETLIDLVNYWPSDVIQSSTLGELITGMPGGKLTPAHRHALERRGIQPRKTPVKIGNSACRVAIIRNPDRWEGADANLIAAELGRGPQIGFGPSGARATLDNLTAA